MERRFFMRFKKYGKGLCLSIFIVMSASLFSQTESGKIWYGVRYLGMSMDTAKIKNKDFKDEIVRQDNKAKRFLKDDRNLYVLIFDGNDSWFKPIPQMGLDNEIGHSIFYTKTGETLKKEGLLYSPTSEKTRSQQYYFRGPENDLLNGNYEWEIKDGTKTISDYKCQKAVSVINWRGKNWLITAWFTKEIPVDDGPGRYVGLPGMILGVRFRGRYYYARKIKLKKMRIRFPADEFLLSFEAYKNFDFSKHR